MVLVFGVGLVAAYSLIQRRRFADVMWLYAVALVAYAVMKYRLSQ